MRIPRIIALAIVIATLAPQAAAAQSETDSYAILAQDGDTLLAAAALAGNGKLSYAYTYESLFADSTIYMRSAYMHWQKISAGESGAQFLLLAGTGKYLGIGGAQKTSFFDCQLVGKDSAAAFFISEGCLTTVTGQGDTLMLVSFAGTSKEQRNSYFRLLRKNNYTESFLKTRLVAMAQPGEIVREGRGIKGTGRLVMRQIINSLNSATAWIDLSAAMLPPRSRMLDSLFATNRFVYVSAEAAALMPASAEGLVAVSAGGAHLARPTTLADTCDIEIPRAFTAGADSLTLSRRFPSAGWSTLCLPFAPAKTPAGLEAFSFAGISDSRVNIKAAGEIRAATPYLVRVAAGTGNVAATFAAAAGAEVPATSDAYGTTLFGTLQRMDFAKQNSTKYYLLEHDGRRFVRAAAGSYLLPCRCGIKMEGSPDTKALSIALSAAGVNAGKAKPAATYDVDGRPFHDGARKPQGIYIIDGKKKYIKEE